MLTIGQLADHCGVTVRAVRHYHRVGLLPEPKRDQSGYRRYDAKAVVRLIRIKVLAEGGVPLIRVHQMLDASPDDFADEVKRIDEALQGQITQLEHRRKQLAGLLAGDRLALPAEVANLLDLLRTIGVTERGIGIERDGWIVMEALCPEVVPDWAREKLEALADSEFQRLYLACDQAWDLDPSDPKLEELAAEMARFAATQSSDSHRAVEQEPGIIVVEQLMNEDVASSSPAWRRLGELSRSIRELGPATTTVQGNGQRASKSVAASLSHHETVQ